MTMPLPLVTARRWAFSVVNAFDDGREQDVCKHRLGKLKDALQQLPDDPKALELTILTEKVLAAYASDSVEDEEADLVEALWEWL